MNLLVIGIALFLSSIVVIELLRFAYRQIGMVKRSEVKKRIKKYTYVQSADHHLDIVKKRVYSQVPFLDRLLHSLLFIRALDRMSIQANARFPIGVYILGAAVLGTVFYLGVSTHMHNTVLALVTALCGLALPFVYLNGLKNRRIRKFQDQLPEALDLIARALKAGHAFTSGMKLAADEFADPLGPEFQNTLEEINYGVSTSKALKGLAQRMDCPEVRYFVVSVILQRETGGNLAEILEGLSQLMREKIKFEGKVRALSAEGKITAWIVVLAPFVTALYMEMNTPGYLTIFTTHPAGKLMLLVCSTLMIAGIVVLKKMVAIKV